MIDFLDAIHFMKLHCLIAASSVVILTSCAKIYRYEEPVSGPIATVTVITEAEYINIGLVSYKDEEYVESKGDVITILNSKAIGYPYKNSKTFKVSANHEFRFSLKVAGVEFINISTLRSHVCMNHAGFIPKENYSYTITHRVANKDCVVSMASTDKSNKLTHYRYCLDPWLNGSALEGERCTENFDFRAQN